MSEEEEGAPTKGIAEVEWITRQRVNQIYGHYRYSSEIPKLKEPGRPRNGLSEEEIKARRIGRNVVAIVLQKILKHEGYKSKKK